MKRVSVNFDQSHSAVDEAKEKFKYQTLLREYLELQKEYVSRKRKLQAAKQKRDLTLAEVRFLRRKHRYLLKSQAPNETKKASTLQEGRNPSTIDHLQLTNSLPVDIMKDDEAEEDVRCKKKKKIKIKNHLIQDKVEGKRKTSWPDQVTLNV